MEEMVSVRVTPDSCYWGRVQELYEKAFPAEERVPLEVLYKPWTHGDFRAFLRGDIFCGLAFLLPDDKTCYLFYLAVEEEMRGLGVGSEILRQLKKMYEGKKIVLEMEVLDPDAENYGQRLLRDKFYQKNGLCHTGVIIEQCGVPYELMSTDARYTLSDYRELWLNVSADQGKTGRDAEEFIHEIFGTDLRE